MLATWSARVEAEFPGPVGKAMVYSLGAAGKRLRPAVVLAVYQELGGTGDAAELATAVEIVHTYSLVHDDLPCMDDDDLRRGRPTTHRVFGSPTAIEAGFRLVPLSARVLAAGARRLRLSPARTSTMGVELYRAAGATGMIGGQVLDLEAEGHELSATTLTTIHRAKTGALIAASAVIGAVAAGGSSEVVAAVRRYGQDVGLAFQIVDDVLDRTASSAQLGKTAGKDAASHKATYAGVLGVPAAREAATAHAADAVDRLGAVGLDSPLLSALADFMLARRS